MLLTLLGVSSLLGSCATGTELRLTSAYDLTTLSKNVNKGTSYSGTTVILDSDIVFTEELSKEFEPIGKDLENNFLGLFDGQGYAISGLKMNYSDEYVGLFGTSPDTEIKNLVIDGSSSVTTFYDYDIFPNIGAVMGHCEAIVKPVRIENIVNMASVTLSGNIGEGEVNLGGLFGYFFSSSQDIFVRNCANYGSVTHAGVSVNSYIGGIAGFFYGYNVFQFNKVYTQNCVNYGTITHSGSTAYLMELGGIIGGIDGCIVESSVNLGKIASNKESGSIGSIIGHFVNYAVVSHCYWTNNNPYNFYGFKDVVIVSENPSFDDNFMLNETVSVGKYKGNSLISALNAFADSYDLISYSKWVLNKGGNPMSFVVNNKKTSFTTNSKLILLPDIWSRWTMLFDGWYTDSACTTPLKNFEISAPAIVYSKYEESLNYYTITFDTRGGTPIKPITTHYLYVIPLPKSSIKDGCEIDHWETEYGEEADWDFAIPAHNITLHAVWVCNHIKNANDLITFAKNVNAGTGYEGTTVFLDSDIVFTDELSKQYEPIGSGQNTYFHGVFDGQGYTISGLKMKSPLKYVGVFGYSAGSAIKSLVVDASCSFESTYSSVAGYVAGIIGEHVADDGRCSIENSVNMASITFSGTINMNDLWIGGIAGEIFGFGKSVLVTNCANYGSVTYSGSSMTAHIGGISGYIAGYSRNVIDKCVTNCFNNGAITYKGTTSNELKIGGIIGDVSRAGIENCVNIGTIKSSGKSDFIGSIAGYLSGSSLVHCYWNAKSYSKSYGYMESSTVTESPSFNDNFKLSETVSVGKYKGDSLVSALNAFSDYYVIDSIPKWLINKGGKTVSFTVNNERRSISMNSKVILLPDTAENGIIHFDGWYTDGACTTPLSNFEISAAMDLYGKYEENYNSYTITFDTRGGTPVEPITVQHLSAVSLPKTTTKTSHELIYWETENGQVMEWELVMPAKSFKLYAVWIFNRIKSANDLITLSNNVNSGTNYAGVTILLDSDITFTDDLSKKFEPIGKDEINCFNGVFDGQGHKIIGLKMTYSDIYSGIFGYSSGMSIRNVVIDSSCSFTNSYKPTSYVDIYAGGLIGYCEAIQMQSVIENVVNLASVTFNGNADSAHGLYVGGLSGVFYSSKNDAFMKNCANYGPVGISGHEGYFSYIGGISGFYDSRDIWKSKVYVDNCFNYGTVTLGPSSKSTFYSGGGIAGEFSRTEANNSVNMGKIVSSANGRNVGSITGKLYSSSITHCYWSENSYSHAYADTSSSTATESPSFKDNFVLNEAVSVGNYKGNSLLSALNAFSNFNIMNLYSCWALNRGGNAVSFITNGNKAFTINAKVILLPSLVNEETKDFYQWYTDSSCTTPLSNFEISAATELYGKFSPGNIYTISFKTKEGATIADPITAGYLSTVELPRDIRGFDKYAVSFWETDDGGKVDWMFTVPPHDVILHPHLVLNHIASAQEFVEFSNNVNKGSVYSEITVYLDSNIAFTDELSKQLEPVGKDSRNFFNGVFDGKGHTISNLKMESSAEYAGLFGYSSGLTIRNIALDASCSITSSSKSGSAYVGGFIGYCTSKDESCIIKDSVNMGSVTFNGDTSRSEMNIGGIAGYFYSQGEDIHVENSANYGPVTHSGNSLNSYIGGIVGYSTIQSETRKVYITNCLNHGTISHSGTTSRWIHLGGVAGSILNSHIENCVNMGTVKSSAQSKFIGSIVGDLSYSSTLLHCYWTRRNIYNDYGDMTGSTVTESPCFNDVSFKLNNAVTVGSYSGDSFVDALNAFSDYYTFDSYSKWAINKAESAVSFTVNGNKMFTTNSKVILLPVIENTKTTQFDGWYRDSSCTTPLTYFEINVATDLYSKYGSGMKYTISFETKEGVTVADPITASYLSTVELPRDIRNVGKYTVFFWETRQGVKVDWTFTVPAHDITLNPSLITNHIASTQEFIEFAKSVNRGTTYSEITMYLDADLDFAGELSKQLEPIGKDYENCFNGVFDGQGHVISNLKMESSAEYAGLFGYSSGLIIRNIVLDASITSTCDPGQGDGPYVGGLVGYCESINEPCTIESSVNMGKVTFSANPSGSHGPYVGGLAGYIASSETQGALVRNCANYGPVTHSGISNEAHLGGLVGKYVGSSSLRGLIQNSMNYGTVTRAWVAYNYYTGGIAGEIAFVDIENCMSAGRIVSAGLSYYTGSIAGLSAHGSAVHTFWSKAVGYGACEDGDLETDKETGEVGVSLDTVNKLRSYSATKAWSKWIFNGNGVQVVLKVGSSKGITVTTQIVLLPDLVDNRELKFGGWFKDAAFTVAFNDAEVKTSTTVYGKLSAVTSRAGLNEIPPENLELIYEEKQPIIKGALDESFSLRLCPIFLLFHMLFAIFF